MDRSPQRQQGFLNRVAPLLALRAPIIFFRDFNSRLDGGRIYATVRYRGSCATGEREFVCARPGARLRWQLLRRGRGAVFVRCEPWWRRRPAPVVGTILRLHLRDLGSDVGAFASFLFAKQRLVARPSDLLLSAENCSRRCKCLLAVAIRRERRARLAS